MNWKQRYDHGMNAVVAFYKKYGSVADSYMSFRKSTHVGNSGIRFPGQ
jgi:hypothetical protein